MFLQISSDLFVNLTWFPFHSYKNNKEKKRTIEDEIEEDMVSKTEVRLQWQNYNR